MVKVYYPSIFSSYYNAQAKYLIVFCLGMVSGGIIQEIYDFGKKDSNVESS